MGKTYYDCPCCEREVWVHSFWGSAWVGAVCHACRDDHGNYTTSNCYVDGPAKRRREQRKRDDAADEARRQRDAYRRERDRLKALREKQERERIQAAIKEKEELRKKQKAEQKKRHEAEQKEREEMKQLLDKQIKDKEAAAQKIRDKIKKINPFKDFKTMKTHEFIKQTAERVTEMGAAGEILEEQIDNIKAELKKSLGDEIAFVESEFVEYQTYANGMKSLTNTFIDEFGKVFDDVKEEKESVIDCITEVLDEGNDADTRSEYQKEMGANITKLCSAANEMAGQLAVMDAYYDKMISDGQYFEQFMERIGDEQDEDLLLDKTIKTLVDDFKQSCPEDRGYDDGMDQTIFTVEYESKSYFRNSNSVFDSVWNTVSDTARKVGSLFGDVTGVGIASTAAVAVAVPTRDVVLDTTRKSLYGSCIKKIENEKYKTTTKCETAELKLEFYDGKKHKEVLEKFTDDALSVVTLSLIKQVKRCKDIKEAAKNKNKELENFKKEGILEMKKHIEKFKKDAIELETKLNSKLPLKKVDCKLLSKNWASLKGEIGSLIEMMKKDNDKMKDV